MYDLISGVDTLAVLVWMLFPASAALLGIFNHWMIASKNPVLAEPLGKTMHKRLFLGGMIIMLVIGGIGWYISALVEGIGRLILAIGTANIFFGVICEPPSSCLAPSVWLEPLSYYILGVIFLWTPLYLILAAIDRVVIMKLRSASFDFARLLMVLHRPLPQKYVVLVVIVLILFFYLL